MGRHYMSYPRFYPKIKKKALAARILQLATRIHALAAVMEENWFLVMDAINIFLQVHIFEIGLLLLICCVTCSNCH